jgi:hypothetical protein
MKVMNKLLQKIRLIGFGCIGVLALIIFLSGGPSQNDHEPLSGINWEDTVESIDNRNRTNNANASGAPQQTVVNGWTTIDWLELISEQLNELPHQNQVTTNIDNRVPSLLLLLVLGACFEWATKGIQLEDKAAKKEMAVEDSKNL